MKDRWLRIEDLYHRALELEESARGDFVRRECADDAGLKSEVETLLRNECDTRFMAIPAFGRGRSAMQPGTRLGRYEIVSAIGKGDRLDAAGRPATLILKLCPGMDLRLPPASRSSGRLFVLPFDGSA